MQVGKVVKEIDWPTLSINVISKMNVMEQRKNEEHSHAVKNWIIDIYIDQSIIFYSNT